MPTPLPHGRAALATSPDAHEAAILYRGVSAAVAPTSGLTQLQVLLLAAIFRSMTGHAVPEAVPPPLGPVEFAQELAHRDLAFRTRIVQVMVLAALVLHPLPVEVAGRLRRYAEELTVDDDMIDVAEAYAAGALDLAAADFARNGYLASVDTSRLKAVHATALNQPWATVTEDPELALEWRSLESLPLDTVGRRVVDFYRDRGFVYPGLPGSAPPLLAQHDWVHVVADYGTSLEGELEVFGFIARANDDPRAFSLLAMIVSLFETGDLARGAGLFEADPGHLRSSGMTTRLADALRRGALLPGSHDFLELDWFTIADRPLDVVRAEFGVPDKDQLAREAGSAGPWQPGGITDYQIRSAREYAAAHELDYLPWRAELRDA